MPAKWKRRETSRVPVISSQTSLEQFELMAVTMMKMIGLKMMSVTMMTMIMFKMMSVCRRIQKNEPDPGQAVWMITHGSPHVKDHHIHLKGFWTKHILISGLK